MIRTLREPVGNTNLRVYRTGSHGDARLLTGGNDFLQAQLAVAENSDKSNKHGDLVDEEYPVSSAHADFMPPLVRAVLSWVSAVMKDYTSPIRARRAAIAQRIAPGSL